MRDLSKYIGKFLAGLTLLTGMLSSMPVDAQSAAQWNYSFVGNNAQALYPGQVSIPQLGTANCVAVTGGLLGAGTCSGTVTSTIINAGTNITTSGTCNSSTALNCTINATAGVTSFNSRTGAVIPGSSDYIGNQIGFTGPGTNALATTLGKETTNAPLNLAADYGAVCDSSTDNTTAIQNAFTDAVTLNKALYIPGCTLTYHYNTTITIATAGNLVVFGDGKFSSKLVYTGVLDAMSLSTLNYLQFSNFGILATTFTAGHFLVNQSIGTNFYIGMSFYNDSTCLYMASNSFSTHIYQSDFNVCGNNATGSGAGIQFGTDKSANSALLFGNHIHDGGIAIYIPNGNNIAITQNDIEGEYQGLVLGGGAGGLTSVDLDDNYIEGSGAGGNIFFTGTIGSTAVNGASLQNDWLGASTANNWTLTGLVVKNLTTFNYAPFLTSTASATVENLITLGTGGLTWSPGVVSRILPPSNVSALPTAGSSKGSAAVVLDATACSTGIITGGGSTVCNVYSNGTNWVH